MNKSLIYGEEFNMSLTFMNMNMNMNEGMSSQTSICEMTTREQIEMANNYAISRLVRENVRLQKEIADDKEILSEIFKTGLDDIDLESTVHMSEIKGLFSLSQNEAKDLIMTMNTIGLNSNLFIEELYKLYNKDDITHSKVNDLINGKSIIVRSKDNTNINVIQISNVKLCSNLT